MRARIWSLRGLLKNLAHFPIHHTTSMNKELPLIWIFNVYGSLDGKMCVYILYTDTYISWKCFLTAEFTWSILFWTASNMSLNLRGTTHSTNLPTWYQLLRRGHKLVSQSFQSCKSWWWQMASYLYPYFLHSFPRKWFLQLSSADPSLIGLRYLIMGCSVGGRDHTVFCHHSQSNS